MTTEEEWQFRIAKLALEPGDVLVVSYPSFESAKDHLQGISVALRRAIPRDVAILFKLDDVGLSVVTRSQIEAAKEPGAFLRRRADMDGIMGSGASQIIVDDPDKP